MQCPESSLLIATDFIEYKTVTTENFFNIRMCGTLSNFGSVDNIRRQICILQISFQNCADEHR